MKKQWINGNGVFQTLKAEEVDKLELEEAYQYKDAQNADLNERLKAVDQKNVDALTALKQEIADSAKTNEAILIKQGEAITKGLAITSKKEEGTIKAAILEHSQVLKDIKAKKDGGVSAKVVFKATQSYPDITGRDELASVDMNINRLPVRKTSILEAFKVDTIDGEFIKYMEELTNTRDAKFVIACATSTHDTKKTLTVRTVQLAKMRDMVDICIDMLDDYSFMESEIRALVFESIQLIKEKELLQGLAVGENDLISIDSIASEFNPANPLADFSAATGTPFEKANLEQLVDAMSAQIQVFGKENKWMPNVVFMSFVDFVHYRNAKDSNGNKLHRTLGDNVPTIAGLEVITSPLILQNTIYVQDSTQGRIKQRKGFTSTLSYENRDNVEHETATLVAYERLQFLVKNIDEDAFMKCSDIEVAITAITKV